MRSKSRREGQLTCWHRFPSVNTSKATRTTALPTSCPFLNPHLDWVTLPSPSLIHCRRKTSLWLPHYYFLSHFTSLISSFVCTFFSPTSLKSVCLHFSQQTSVKASQSHTKTQWWCAHAGQEFNDHVFANTESLEFTYCLPLLQAKALENNEHMDDVKEFRW